MKKVIKGARYDTEKAKYITGECVEGPRPGELKMTDIYRTKTGNFFLHCITYTKNEAVEDRLLDSETITPITAEEAKEFLNDKISWYEQKCIFEGDPKTAVTLYISDYMLEKLDAVAVGNVSRSDVIINALKEYLK